MPADSFKSVVEMFHHRIKSTPDRDAYMFKVNGVWQTVNWRTVGQRARNIACGLRALGLQDEERCSILSSTRLEWVLADMGVLAAAGAVTTIYPSNTPTECEYIIKDSESVFVFAEDDLQVGKLAEVRENLTTVKKVITINGRSGHGGWVITLDELEKQGAEWDAAFPGAYDEFSDRPDSQFLATLIYTSGTTGKPKGVMLAHDCWLYEGEAVDNLGILLPSDRQFLFLPLAHSFAKVLEIAAIHIGVCSVVDADLNALVKNIGETHPTFMIVVPRILEKVYNKVVGGAKEGGGLKYSIFKWSVATGKQVSALRQQHKEPGGLLAIKYRIADKLVFSKLKNLFGGQMRFFVSGGAPLSKEIAEFFHACDILVLEGYGLTESSAATFVNRPDHYKFGTVGPPVPGTEVRLAEDGEILVRGRGIMKGYYNRPDDTAQVLAEGGWLHTGDIGEVDADSFLRITDRKKDIIVTAGGKNVAPQNIESLLKLRCSYISQVVVHGDKRNFCTALITVNEETTGKWAKENGITWTSYAELAERSEVRDLIQQGVDAVNGELASYETIKKFAILDHDITLESGEMTPKMSIKRRVVEKNNQHILDSFYSGSVATLK